MKLAVVGGGAAGFFAAIWAKTTNPNAQVTIYEKSAKLLSKVRISGGGRCNVTTSCFGPKQLVENYPRGGRELLGPFHHFGPKDTVAWFEERGVALKVEADGRIFPKSDRSEDVIACLVGEAEKLGVMIETRAKVEELPDRVVLATGSSKQGHEWAREVGHTIVEPVPSLFTFNIPNFDFVDLAGVSVREGTIGIVGTKLEQKGPILITHWGLSGPAALKLSAWGARLLAERDYTVQVKVNWGEELPKRLRKRLGDEVEQVYQVEGKTTNKAEFVTAGGVALSEVDFRTMESRKRPGLFFAGEILNIDGVTGGFNFQNAWTTGYLAGKAASS